MAHAQGPRSQLPQRPYYEQQQAPYASSAQYCAAEYEYAEGDQGAYYTYPTGGHSQPYADSNGIAGAGRRNNQSRWQESDASCAIDVQRGGSSQQRGEGESIQQPDQRPSKVEGQANSDSRAQGRWQKSRFPARDPYQQPKYQYQFEGRHRPQQDHQAEQASWKVTESYGCEEPPRIHQEDWASNQQHKQVSMGTTNRYPRPNQDVAHQSHEVVGNTSRGPSPNIRWNSANAPNPRHDGYTYRSMEGQSQNVSAKSKTANDSKPAFRITESPKSPDMVAWDNPFPTFPTKTKKVTHLSSKKADGPSGRARSRAGSVQDKAHDSRPQTASSKSSNYTTSQVQEIAEPAKPFNNQHGGFCVQYARWPQDEVLNQGSEHLEPDLRDGGSMEGRVDQHNPLPILNGRHSEDNRTRPTNRHDAVANPGYERSRTMPNAILEAVGQSNHRPRQPGLVGCHEPDPVASYYGPEDRDYLPANPVDGAHQRPYAPVRVHSKESKQKNGGLALAQEKKLQQHVHQGSHGDFSDNCYDTTQQDYYAPVLKQGSQLYSSIDDDMPNFDAVPELSAAHRRGMTIDHHLEPKETAQEDLPTNPLPQDYGYRDNGNSPNFEGEFSPRSRSQRNMEVLSLPRAKDDKYFEVGIPKSPRRAPAKAHASGGYVGDAKASIGYSRGGPPRQDRFVEGPDPQGPIPSAGYGQEPRDWRNHAPTSTSLPSVPYQENGPLGRYRSPGLQDGHQRQGPIKPPRREPSPIDRSTVRGPHPTEYRDGAQPDHFSSPPSKDDQYPSSPMKPPSGGPSPVTRIGLISPPSRQSLNPDALPSHPAPVRPGLMKGSALNQAAKPPPVRQYTAAPSPLQQFSSAGKLGSSQSTDNKEPPPVTHQELGQLRQAVERRPDDQATQLTLAKKLVEASVVLVDERSDPRTRSKLRDKYVSEALKIVKKASTNGYTEGTFYLADAYSRGAPGLESDVREAFKLYQTAAKAGHAQAAYRVAVCCEIGQEEGGGTSRDAVKAMQWYKRAATLGDTPAMYKLGIISLKGLLGQPRNPEEALKWLKKAADRADRENPHALHELALLHSQPSNNGTAGKDEAYARKLFTQAANLGYKFSQFRLGCAYEYGLLGCPVDPRQSIAWYSKAAVQEEHQSELALSGWYLTGSEGVLQQSDTEAYLWARKAAQAGLAKAEYAMGYFTEVGIGAPANLEDAKRWYWRAASQNFQKARDRLEDLRKGGGTKQKMRVSRSNMKKQSDGECLVM